MSSENFLEFFAGAFSTLVLMAIFLIFSTLSSCQDRIEEISDECMNKYPEKYSQCFEARRKAERL